MITTDTGAKKIEGTDNWRQIFGAHNDTVDAYDANIEALQDALGIVVNGNQSAVSASSGQFIILKNSSIVDSGDDLLPDGLYTAAKAIPANTVIDKTYLTADAAGGLNALNSKISKASSVSLNNCATLEAVFTALLATDNGIGSGGVGSESSNSFKTLITDPNQGSWVTCWVQLIIADGNNCIALCTATNVISNGMVKYKYLKKTGTYYSQTSWL